MALTTAKRAEILRALRARRGRARRVPALQHPDPQIREYTKRITAYMDRVRKLVLAQLLPLLEGLPEQKPRGARGDAIDERRVRELFRQLAKKIIQDTPNSKLAAAAQAAAFEVSRFQRAQLRSAFVASLGIDLFALFQTEPNLRAAVQAFTKRNVAKIRTVSTRYLVQVEQLALEAVRAGERAPSLAKKIAERGHVADSNARRIANDQIGKFYGQLNQERQQALGFGRYRWRTVRDNRVREEHVHREGEVFDWSSPPNETEDDGHPGTPINCRCYAEPMIEDVFRQLAA